MNFLGWNDKLAAHFFRPEFAGRQVFLFVTEDLLDELGAETGESWRDFVAVVRAGHAWLPGGQLSLCQKARHCCDTWRGQGLQYPAFIAYLGLFVLAAGKEGDFAPHAYYPRLRALIGEEGQGMLPGFDKMSKIWEELDLWATYEQGGELGTFTYRRVGGWVHVGVPLAQTILTEPERRALPSIFAAAGVDPTSSPSDAELRGALRSYGGHVLRHRTMELLVRGGGDEGEVLDLLIATAREELETWDGHIEEVGEATERSVYGNLRLCAVVDRVAGAVRFAIRCTMNREFPNTGLVLKSVGTRERFRCEGELLHWSTPLQDAASRERLDGGHFDWAAGVELREEQLGWRFRLQGRPIRIFRNGEGEGLRGLVEVHQLSAGVPFVLAARNDCWSRLEGWGKSSCQQFERVSVVHGMPEGWGLYRAATAESDEQVRAEFPSLAFPHSVRLLVRGGIRSGRGSTYLHFGMPVLLLEGGRGDETVCCNGVDLRPDDGIYHPPANLPVGTPLAVEVCRGGEVLKRQSFSVVDDFDWQWRTPRLLFDRFGIALEGGQGNPAGVAGAALVGVSPVEIPLSPPASCFEGRRVFFLGPVPGQVVSWPKEDLPAEWAPVWAIPMTERGRAVFCGGDFSSAGPAAAGAASYGTKKVRLWKEVVHYWRKKITPPAATGPQRLWKQYQEVARRVRT